MKKQFMLLFTCLLLLYLSVPNEEGIHISSMELLATGLNKENKIQITYFLLNIATITIYITIIENSISSIFRLHNYIATRGGQIKLLFCLLKVVLKNILLVLLIKQIIYILLGIISLSFTRFYVYDMVSTLLTLNMLGLILIAIKIHGVRSTNSFFIVLSFSVVAQFLSYYYPIFSSIVIASSNWKEMYLSIFILKNISILVLFFIVFLKSKSNNIIGVF